MAQKTEKAPAKAPAKPANTVKPAKPPAKAPAKPKAKAAKSAETAESAVESRAPESSAAPASAAPRGRQQVKTGRVVSNKMDKTVVVAVENTVTHRLYHRYLKRTSRFAAHDEQNQCSVGDEVEIVSSRPLSRTKRWRVRRILKRAE